MHAPLTRRTLLGSAAAASSLLAAPAIAQNKKFKIALSNSLSATSGASRWRTSSRPRCRWSPSSPRSTAAGSTPATTSASSRQQISNLIAQRVDAISSTPPRPPGSTASCSQAADRGILVVSFDNTVTTPCGLKVNTDQVKFGEQLGRVRSPSR